MKETLKWTIVQNDINEKAKPREAYGFKFWVNERKNCKWKALKHTKRLRKSLIETIFKVIQLCPLYEMYHKITCISLIYLIFYWQLNGWNVEWTIRALTMINSSSTNINNDNNNNNKHSLSFGVETNSKIWIMFDKMIIRWLISSIVWFHKFNVSINRTRNALKMNIECIDW